MTTAALLNDAAALTTCIETRFHRTHREALHDRLAQVPADLAAHVRLENDPRFESAQA